MWSDTTVYTVKQRYSWRISFLFPVLSIPSKQLVPYVRGQVVLAAAIAQR